MKKYFCMRFLYSWYMTEKVNNIVWYDRKSKKYMAQFYQLNLKVHHLWEFICVQIQCPVPCLAILKTDFHSWRICGYDCFALGEPVVISTWTNILSENGAKVTCCSKH